ncbi:MAG: tetratricopeptide repeat protein [Ardenticatenaceae bacterium]|nr:tetratricopeptide repeat protein [Ardenticatenaceae bacterium]
MDVSHLASLLEQANTAQENKAYDTTVRLYTELIAETAVHAGDPQVREIRLAALRENGRLQRLLGHQEAALTCFQQAYLDAGSSEQAVDSLALLANQHNSMGNYDEAMQACREALHLTEALNYSAGRAAAFQVLGRTYAQQGHPEEAVHNLQKALAIFEQIGNQTEVARTHNWIGIGQMEQWRLDKAIYAFNCALEKGAAISDVLRSTILNNLGECYQYLFDFEQALAHHRAGLSLIQKLNFTTPQDDLLRNLGVDLYHVGRVDEGTAYLYEALHLSEANGNQDIRLQVLDSLVYAELERDRPDMAMQYAQTLRVEAEKLKARQFVARALYGLGLVYQNLGESVTAEQFWQQALFLAHETHQPNLIWQLHAGLAQIVGIAPLAETHNRIAAEVIDQIVYPIEDPALRQKFLSAPAVRAVLDGQQVE